MAVKSRYEYETSPRKLEPDISRRKKVQKKVDEKAKEEAKKKQEKEKRKAKIEKAKKVKLITYICVGFAILFAVSYRNSQIDEHFGKVQKLKKELSDVQKENERLRINIENSVNLNNIEKAAKDILGMQRLTNNQRVYIELPKEDYIESPSEEIIKYDNKKGVEKILENIFNNM